MAEVNKNPCTENCEVQVLGLSKNTARCIECPDKKDYLIKTEGGEPHHRRFNPNKLGYVKYDPKNKPADVESKSTGRKSRPKKEVKINPKFKASSKACIKCNTSWPREEVPLNFSYNYKSFDGYLNTCKKCVSENMASAKRKRYAEKLKKEKVDQKLEEIRLEKQRKESMEKTCETCKTIFRGEDEIKDNFDPHEMSKEGFKFSCKNCEVKKTKKDLATIDKNIVMVDFSKNTDLLNDLIEMAKNEFRSNNNQILYLIKQAIEKEIG